MLFSRNILLSTSLALVLSAMANSSDAGIISAVDGIGTSNVASVGALPDSAPTVGFPTFGGTYPAAAFLVDVKEIGAAGFSFTFDSTRDYPAGDADRLVLSFTNNTGKDISSLQLSVSGGASIFGYPSSGDTYTYPGVYGSGSFSQTDSAILAQSSTFSWSTPITAGSSVAFYIPISLSAYNGNSGSFDVSLTTAAVPEPSSMALLGLGGLGLAAYRRRRAKQTQTV